MIRIEVFGRWRETGGVRRGDFVRIVGHPKTIPHSHERSRHLVDVWPRPYGSGLPEKLHDIIP